MISTTLLFMPGPVLLLVKGKLIPLPVTSPTQEPCDPVAPAWGLPSRVHTLATLPLSLARLTALTQQPCCPRVGPHELSVPQCP